MSKWGIKLRANGESFFVKELREVAGREVVLVDQDEDFQNLLEFESKEQAEQYAERMGWIMYRVLPISKEK